MLEWNVINKKHKVTINGANYEAIILVMESHNTGCNITQGQSVMNECN